MIYQHNISPPALHHQLTKYLLTGWIETDACEGPTPNMSIKLGNGPSNIVCQTIGGTRVVASSGWTSCR